MVIHHCIEKMSEKTPLYKYCIVPTCKNTTVTSPDKYFFPVPRVQILRNKWCTAIKRRNKQPLSNKSSLHCCEDHFDVEYDVENYVKYKLVGGRMILKSGVLPHRFDCQQISTHKVLNSALTKCRQKDIKENLGTEDVKESYKAEIDDFTQSVEFVSCGNTTIEDWKGSIYEYSDESNDSSKQVKTKNKGTQVNIQINKRDKNCQTKRMKIRGKTYLRNKKSKCC